MEGDVISALSLAIKQYQEAQLVAAKEQREQEELKIKQMMLAKAMQPDPLEELKKEQIRADIRDKEEKRKLSALGLLAEINQDKEKYSAEETKAAAQMYPEYLQEKEYKRSWLPFSRTEEMLVPKLVQEEVASTPFDVALQKAMANPEAAKVLSKYSGDRKKQEKLLIDNGYLK